MIALVRCKIGNKNVQNKPSLALKCSNLTETIFIQSKKVFGLKTFQKVETFQLIFGSQSKVGAFNFSSRKKRSSLLDV